MKTFLSLGGQKQFVLEKKSKSDFYILLVSQTHWSLNRKQRCENFWTSVP